MEDHTVWAPDYYKDFICKCGECRTPCCGGWGISLTKEEYYRLVGVSLPKNLRHKLDCALVMSEHPDNTSFARIAPDYTGFCPIMDSEGYCALQRKYGEDILPIVCRMYPRSYKRADIPELCTSGSCEKTVELLTSSVSPLTFEKINVSMPFSGITVYTPQTDSTRALRMEYISIISDRTRPLSERMRLLGEKTADIKVPEYSPYECVSFLKDIISKLEQASPTLYKYGHEALKAVNAEGDEMSDGNYVDSFSLYIRISREMREKHPDMDIYFEKLLVNHMFYIQFPYVSEYSNQTEAYKDFCTAAALLVFISLCCSHVSETKEAFVDAASEVLRFLEHSFFYTSESYSLHEPTEKEKNDASEAYGKLYRIYG